jgi:Family of unknown function (DUF6615)
MRFPKSTVLPSNSLCLTFETQAEKIWRTLTSAQAMGIDRGETTITDDFLLEVQTAHPTDVITVQFLNPQERFTGADWEWWLTDDQSWFGLLIQAKRLGRTTHKYEKLKHKVGNSKTPQIELLLNCARRKGIDPLYFFYNYNSGRLGSLQWNCGSMDPNKMAQLGCTVAHAAAVKRLLAQGGAGLPKMSTISNPLRCLVCCTGLGSPDNSLPGRAHGVTRRLRTLALDGSPDESVVDEPAPRRDPPSYVRRLMETPVEERGRIIEELRREIGQVGALVVLREKRED